MRLIAGRWGLSSLFNQELTDANSVSYDPPLCLFFMIKYVLRPTTPGGITNFPLPETRTPGEGPLEP